MLIRFTAAVSSSRENSQPNLESARVNGPSAGRKMYHSSILEKKIERDKSKERLTSDHAAQNIN
jgi:hypothetical protein